MYVQVCVHAHACVCVCGVTVCTHMWVWLPEEIREPQEVSHVLEFELPAIVTHLTWVRGMVLGSSARAVKYFLTAGLPQAFNIYYLHLESTKLWSSVQMETQKVSYFLLIAWDTEVHLSGMSCDFDKLLLACAEKIQQQSRVSEELPSIVS